MAVDVVGPDGKHYNFPDGTTKDQAVAFFKKQSGSTSPKPQPTPKKTQIEKQGEEGVFSKIARGGVLGAASAAGIPETTSQSEILSSLGPLGFLKHPLDTAYQGVVKPIGKQVANLGNYVKSGGPLNPSASADFVKKSFYNLPMVGSALEQFGPEVARGVRNRDPEQAAHGVGGLVTTAALFKGGESAATKGGPVTAAFAKSERARAARILNELIQPTDKEIKSQPGAQLAENIKPKLTSHSLMDFVREKTDKLTDELNRRTNAATARGTKTNIYAAVNTLVNGPIRKAAKLPTAGNAALITKLRDLQAALNTKPLTQMTAADLLELRRSIKEQAYEGGGSGIVRRTSRRVSKLLGEELHKIDPRLEAVDNQVRGLIDAGEGAKRRVEDLLRGKHPDPTEWYRATISGAVGFTGVYEVLHSMGGAVAAALAYPAIKMIQRAYKATPSATTRAYLHMRFADVMDMVNKLGQKTGQATPGAGGAPGRPPAGPGLPPAGRGSGPGLTPTSPLAGAGPAGPRGTTYGGTFNAKSPLPQGSLNLLTEGTKQLTEGKPAAPAASEPAPASTAKTPRYAVHDTPKGQLKATFVDGKLKNVKLGNNTFRNPDTIANLLTRVGTSVEELKKKSEGVQPEGLHGEGPEALRAKNAERKAAERAKARAEVPGETRRNKAPEVREPTAQTSDPEALLLAIEASQKALPEVYGLAGKRGLDAIMQKAGAGKWDASTTFNAIMDLIEDLQSKQQ